ncbi:PREDICTED: RING1 and YY1-binding protein [Bison bison bison]|uniref:RING1 and YY1-binding protein n=1 Tax=Bison bison bison TaxID=43346 RepID=A0A6P3J184_BISBB|nr:PREDICTED: RING1 and YY1-binding protein [Bison bison bison]
MDFYLQEGISQGLSPKRHAVQLHEGGGFMTGATLPVLTLVPHVLLAHGLGKGLRGGLSTRGRKFTRGRYKALRGRGAEGSGGTRAKRGPASSGGTASLEALRASRRLKAPPARANCAQLLPRGGFGARGPATALRGGRAGAKAQSGYPGAATCALPGSHAPPRRAAGPPAGTRAPSAHTLRGTHTDGPAHVHHAPPSPAPRPRPRGAGRRLPIGRPASDARRPAPPLVSHSAEAALAGTSLVRRLAAAARRRRAVAAAAGGGVAPARGRRPCAPQPWRLLLSRPPPPPPPPPPLLPDQKGDLTRPKRQAKPAADEGFWDCSVCTFRNSAEAFKCSICDVRKGTSTRKPRINSQLVAQQVAQQYATPPPPKKEKKEKVEKQDKEKPEKDKEISPSVTKKNTNKKTKPKSDILKDPPSEVNSIQSANATTKTSETNHTSRPRLKNVDRSTAQQLAVTVGNVTVIITDFKEKTRSSSTSSSTVTSSAGSEQQNQSSSGSESTDKGSSRSSTPKGDMSAVNDESF